MRGFVLFIILLSQLIVSCSDSPTCISDAADYSYIFIPTSTTTNCNNQTPISKSEALKCKHGGKVLVKSGSEKQLIQIMTPNQADKHAQNTGHYAMSGSLIEDHDAAIKNLSAAQQAAILDTIPQEKISSWLFYDKAVDYGPNGCGIWATAVCNRTLGLASGRLTQSEWDTTYAELGSFYGITPFKFIANYYQRKGYCSETKPMAGYYQDYIDMNHRLSSGCDVKLFFARQSVAWFLPGANPHIETVVDVVLPVGAPNQYDELCPDCYLHTNSWGTYAKISGGWCSEFSHEQNHIFGGVDKNNSDNFAWPANDARVWVQSTCDCKILEDVLPSDLDNFLVQ